MQRANIIRTVDGAELFYRDWGNGTPVVFLSGWALPSDFWSYQMTPLSEAGFRCIAYDRRGHGRSSDPGHGFDFDTLADDLAAVLDTLQLSSVQIVAHSMSAGEVIRYAAKRRGYGIQRIALVGPTLPCLVKSADNPEGLDRALLDMTRRQILAGGFSLMPAAELTVYQSAPHGLPVTHAGRLAQDLQSFLRSPPVSLPVAARRGTCHGSRGL